MEERIVLPTNGAVKNFPDLLLPIHSPSGLPSPVCSSSFCPLPAPTPGLYFVPPYHSLGWADLPCLHLSAGLLCRASCKSVAESLFHENFLTNRERCESFPACSFFKHITSPHHSTVVLKYLWKDIIWFPVCSVPEYVFRRSTFI